MVGQRKPRVILIAGPMGAGKTSTAARIGEAPGWTHLSEDDAWVRIKAGRPAGELRTAAEQPVVWGQVLEALQGELDAGRSVALEFIVYEMPPRPLIAYQQALRARGVPFETRILQPHVETVMRRIEARGRPGDADLSARRRDVLHQLGCLTAPHVDEAWVIDTSEMRLDEVYERYFRGMVEDEGL